MNRRLHQVQNWPEMARQAKWSAAALAKNCGVSLRTLERYFLKENGKRPKVWLSEQRQQRASELIQGGSLISLCDSHAGNTARHFMRQKPVQHAGIGSRFGDFGNDVGVEKESQASPTGWWSRGAAGTRPRRRNA